jgi:hypothetical protein
MIPAEISQNDSSSLANLSAKRLTSKRTPQAKKLRATPLRGRGASKQIDEENDEE